MSRRGKAWLVCHFCIFMRMARFSLESLTTPRAIPSTTFTSSSLSFVSLSWAVLNSSNFFASPSTLRGASKVMKSDTGNNFAVDAGVGGCIDAAEGGPWGWGMFKARTLLFSLVYLGEWDWRPCWVHLLQHWCQHLAHRGGHHLRRIYDMFTRPLVGDHLLNYLARQIKDMLRDPLASQKLASLVREVVTVVVQQVIPTTRINSTYLAGKLHKKGNIWIETCPPWTGPFPGPAGTPWTSPRLSASRPSTRSSFVTAFSSRWPLSPVLS